GVNFLPWTGPMLRAAAALHVSTADLFRPLIPVQIVGLLFVFAVAYGLGRREERRLGLANGAIDPPARALTQEQRALRRPSRFVVNVLLTLALMVVLVAGTVDPGVAFMAGAAAALLINYPGSDLQRARVNAHGQAAVMMAAILFAAGAFNGIMK